MHHSRSTRQLTSAVASFAAIGALAACTNGSQGQVEVGGTIESVLSADPSTFDPAMARAVNDYTLHRLLYDTLLRKGPDGEVVSGLASDWEAESATRATFTLRDDASCSDGTPVDAEVVADSLRYLADPSTGSTWKPLVFGPGDVTISTEGDSTLAIELSEPFAPLLDTLTLPQTGVVCPAGVSDPEALAAGGVEGAYSGPYALTEATPGIGYSLDFREGYEAWPGFAGELEGTAPASLYFGVSADASSIVNQMLSGDLHLSLLAASDNIDRINADESLDVVESSDVSVYLVFNQRPGRFFADQANRVAVAQAVDPDAFDEAFSGGRNRVITSVASQDLACVIDGRELMPEHNPSTAAEQLDGASFKFLSYTAINRPATDYVYSVLSEAGADVTLENPDIATWSATVNNPEGDWDVAVFGDRNTARLVSASLDRFMGPAIEDGARNFGAIENDEGYAALTAGLASTDEESRCDNFETAQRTMLERTDLVPLVAAVQYTVTAENVTVQAYGGSIDHGTLRITEE